MYHILQHDLAELESLLERTKDESLDYLMEIRNMPTSTPHRSMAERNLNDRGLGGMAALIEFKQRFESILVGSSGPRYWGFVTGGATPASIMGDWLASTYDQNPQTDTGHGDVSAQIEVEAIGLFLELLNLPKTFNGGFVSGAMMSNFTCLATARQWLGNELGLDVAKKGLQGIPAPTVLGASPHSSSIKALSLLGMGRDSFRAVPTMKGKREAIDVEALEEQLHALHYAPAILVSSAATVNSGDFDDFVKIAELKSKYRFWWHIDAAFGGLVACSPRYRPLVEGWEGADSITVDCHKWLNVPYENAAFFIREEHGRSQVETFQNHHAPYLGNGPETLNYLNLLPENSRRLKALPVWFSLVAYGKEGHRDLVEHCIDLAQRFGKGIQEHGRFELLAPIHLNIVAFTLKNTGDEMKDKFLDILNGRGKIFITPTVFGHKKGFRAAFVNWRTTPADIELALEELEVSIRALGINQ